ncbi:nitronate monooxygenase [Chishuiella changwenlii]|uniref:Propionate 3-nitronate monooxygenase n=1 Tax=Chishuiella changwenlii TaxID=1434701 RepID=A0A1M6SRL2_9FLAO|nr:nitronate monooxygenase [Chishuiella changwenlii]GGF07430.1 putative nitronate monooxygenase [Chishuiella changwenlii]SHK47280.1 nitronate monooxygenase [Chishuiella changwenlii]
MKSNKSLHTILPSKYPIIQAPMFGVTTPEMVAAANRANCLGSLALGDLNADKCIEQIRKTKELTDQAFIANIFVHQLPEVNHDLIEHYNTTKLYIEQLAKEHHLDVKIPEFEEIKLNSYHEQIDAIIAENCKIVSFTFGNLDDDSIHKLKANDILTIGTCTSLEEALLLEKSGIDILNIQGWEAGGHRGSFKDHDIPKIGGLALLNTIKEHVQNPLIYSGGVTNARIISAVKKMGADGFQIGSLLLNSEESALHEFEKNKLSSIKEDDIVLTKSFSGRYARGIKNTFIEKVEQSNYILPYPYQNKLTNELRKVAKLNKNSEFTSNWIGQSIPKLSRESTTTILNNLINEIETFD